MSISQLAQSTQVGSSSREIKPSKYHRNNTSNNGDGYSMFTTIKQHNTLHKSCTIVSIEILS